MTVEEAQKRAAVQQYLAALKKDAERYRFLRDADNWGEDPDTACWEGLGEASLEAFDAIVDYRMNGDK